jgi:hypothetical protein
MNVEFACVRNSVLGMRAHAKLETGHVTEMSGRPSLALSTSSCNFFCDFDLHVLLQVPLRKPEKSWFHPNLLMRNLQ